MRQIVFAVCLLGCGGSTPVTERIVEVIVAAPDDGGAVVEPPPEAATNPALEASAPKPPEEASAPPAPVEASVTCECAPDLTQHQCAAYFPMGGGYPNTMRCVAGTCTPRTLPPTCLSSVEMVLNGYDYYCCQ
jgi:hypothetical protein